MVSAIADIQSIATLLNYTAWWLRQVNEKVFTCVTAWK